MGIYKVSSKVGKSPQSLRGLLNYVFGEDAKSQQEGINKTTIANCQFVGEQYPAKSAAKGRYYPPLNAESVFRDFQRTKHIWGKESGRQYFHVIHSFHEDEKITGKQAVDITRQIIEKSYPGYQAVIVPHHDKGRVDVHVVLNSVSSIDGKKIHTTKKDIERQKQLCNQICKQHGFSVPEKGKTFYGEDLAPDTLISWNKDTYETLSKQKTIPREPSQTHFDMIKLLIIILDALLTARSLTEFIEMLRRNLWKVTYTEKRKRITFESMETGRKFRASNLNKTYGSKLRYVFGEDFVLDKEHIQQLLDIPPIERKLHFHAAVQAVVKDVPAWTPDTKAKTQKPAKSKEWTPPKTVQKYEWEKDR